MGFLRSGKKKGPLIALFLLSSFLLVIRTATTPGFIGHQFPYFLHYPVVPFNNHLAPHFNSVQPPIVAQLAHSQQFFPQQWFQNQNPQFLQNNTVISPNPATRQSQPQSSQDGGDSNSRSQFQIADIRARLVQRNQTATQRQPSPSPTPPAVLQTSPNLNGNVNNNNNAIGQNNFNFDFGQPQNFQNLRRDQQNGGLSTPSQLTNFPNPNVPWQNQQNFGWGWDNIGWNFNSGLSPSSSPMSSSAVGVTPSAASLMSDSGENSDAPVMMHVSDLERQQNSTSLSLKSNITMLENKRTMVSTENPLADAVAKFRRIVTQIREITRNELRS